MLELIAYWIIGIGLAFDIFGTVGLVRLPDIYNRAQAATKCVTLGTCMIVLGVFLWALGADNGAMAVRAVLCGAFVLVTSPVAAHAICRGAYISGVPLWEGSVVDEFKQRAQEVRNQQAAEQGAQEGEEAQAS